MLCAHEPLTQPRLHFVGVTARPLGLIIGCESVRPDPEPVVDLEAALAKGGHRVEGIAGGVSSAFVVTEATTECGKRTVWSTA